VTAPLMTNAWGSRRNERITFQRSIDARIIGIDGTWSRPCQVADISQSGAKLIVDQAIGGLNLKEFFLVLATTGRVWRRCELTRINGDELGVRFLKTEPAKQSGTRTRSTSSPR
jgi:PilZ domain